MKETVSVETNKHMSEQHRVGNLIVAEAPFYFIPLSCVGLFFIDT